MTFVTLLAVLCHTVAGVNACVTEIVTDNTLDEHLNIISCMNAQAGVVDWMSKHPVYHTGWTLSSWKCQFGNKASPPKDDRA